MLEPQLSQFWINCSFLGALGIFVSSYLAPIYPNLSILLILYLHRLPHSLLILKPVFSLWQQKSAGVTSSFSNTYQCEPFSCTKTQLTYLFGVKSVYELFKDLFFWKTELQRGSYRGRWKGHPSTICWFMPSSGTGLGRVKSNPRARSQKFHPWCRGTRTCPIFSWFPRLISRDLDQKLSSWDSLTVSIWCRHHR